MLADFRDSMLYALLCSVALRPAKDALVQHIDRSLADSRRSIGGALLALAALPLTALWDAYDEGRTVLAKWRQAVAEELSRRQAQLKQRGEAAVGAPPTPMSPRTPRSAAASAAASAPRTTMPTMPSLAVYGHAAVRVLKSRWGWRLGWDAVLGCCFLLPLLPMQSMRSSDCSTRIQRVELATCRCPSAGEPPRSAGSSGS